MGVSLSGTLYVQFLFHSEPELYLALFTTYHSHYKDSVYFCLLCHQPYFRPPPTPRPQFGESVEGKEHVLFSTYHGEWHVMHAR